MPDTMLHSPEFLADVVMPGPNGKLFHASPAVELPGSTALMYDSTAAASCPTARFYGAYLDGSFANVPAMRADHPGGIVYTITPDGRRPAQIGDVEPGCMTNAQLPAFLKAGGLGWYTSASNMAACITEVRNAGLDPNAYTKWTAHWTGQHICGPATCGYPQADGTQFASNASFDTSLIKLAAFVVLAFPLVPGEAGYRVMQLQEAINVWAHVLGLPAALIVDGQFGPATEVAVRAAQQYLRQTVDGRVSSGLFVAITAAPPAPPVEPSTAPGALSATPHMTANFAWGPATVRGQHAAYYDFQVTRGAGTEVARRRVAGQHVGDVPLGLAGGGYSWRVAGLASNGVPGPWSAVKAIVLPAAARLGVAPGAPGAQDLILSLLRTFAATAAGVIITWLANTLGLHLDAASQGEVLVLLTGVFTSAYYLAARVLEHYVSGKFGWLLLSPKPPAYPGR